MLKIKDEIDLKELEKFGFKLYENEKSQYWFNNRGIEIKGDKVTRKGLCRRQISNPHYFGHDKHTFDVLYDLIRAEMVEKVVEKDE